MRISFDRDRSCHCRGNDGHDACQLKRRRQKVALRRSSVSNASDTRFAGDLNKPDRLHGRTQISERWQRLEGISLNRCQSESLMAIRSREMAP
jgi:hypothetical protein